LKHRVATCLISAFIGTAAPSSAAEPLEQPADLAPHVAVEINPLSLLALRWAVQVEMMPARHSAFVVNPWFTSRRDGGDVTPGMSDPGNWSASITGYGTEIGYRYYTGHRINGFFIGPSLLLAHFDERTTSSSLSGFPARSYFAEGAALDLGGAYTFDFGLVLSGGVGVQVMSDGPRLLSAGDGAVAISGTELFYGGGVRPRILFSLGYAFF
jgi:hypothetical protein